MSLTLKLASLTVRTLAKPISNRIKHQARDHEHFRKLCVAFAQGLHRIDMRLRLSLLKDPDLIQRQIAHEKSLASASRQSKRSHSPPTAPTESEAATSLAAQRAEDREIEERMRRKPKIRPLSEGKAIDMGANFAAESFVYCVSIAVLLFETARGRRNAAGQRGELAARLERLEEEGRGCREEIGRRGEEVRVLREEVEGRLRRGRDGALGSVIALGGKSGDGVRMQVQDGVGDVHPRPNNTLMQPLEEQSSIEPGDVSNSTESGAKSETESAG